MLAYPQVGVLCLKELEELMNMCWFSAKLFISFGLIILGKLNGLGSSRALFSFRK